MTVQCEACNDDGILENGDSCQDCCQHYEHDHYICLDCGKDLDPGAFIDAAEYAYGDDR